MSLDENDSIPPFTESYISTYLCVLDKEFLD